MPFTNANAMVALLASQGAFARFSTEKPTMTFFRYNAQQSTSFGQGWFFENFDKAKKKLSRRTWSIVTRGSRGSWKKKSVLRAAVVFKPGAGWGSAPKRSIRKYGLTSSGPVFERRIRTREVSPNLADHPERQKSLVRQKVRLYHRRSRRPWKKFKRKRMRPRPGGLI